MVEWIEIGLQPENWLVIKVSTLVVEWIEIGS